MISDISSTIAAGGSESDDGDSLDDFVVYTDESDDEYEDSGKEDTPEPSPGPSPQSKTKGPPAKGAVPVGKHIRHESCVAPLPASLPANRPAAAPAPAPALAPTPQPAHTPAIQPARPARPVRYGEFTRPTRPAPQPRTVTTNHPTMIDRSDRQDMSGPVKKTQLVPPSDSIRAPLDAYGEAIIRCSLDHTPSTASKLESDIAKASQAVVDYHKAAIIIATQDIQKQLTAKETRLASALGMNDILRYEANEQSRSMKEKDKELEEKHRELSMFKIAQAEEEQKKKGDQARLKKMEEEKRKRVLESWEASKKAKV